MLTVIKFIEFDKMDSRCSVSAAKAACRRVILPTVRKLETIPYELLGGADAPLTKSMRVHLAIRLIFCENISHLGRREKRNTKGVRCTTE